MLSDDRIGGGRSAGMTLTLLLIVNLLLRLFVLLVLLLVFLGDERDRNEGELVGGLCVAWRTVGGWHNTRPQLLERGGCLFFRLDVPVRGERTGD
jgi:hypothetical protein